jgi:microcystin-dependent protein
LASHTHQQEYGVSGFAGSATDWYMKDGSDTSGYQDHNNLAPTGGDTPHNTMPPFVTVNYIIKT